MPRPEPSCPFDLDTVSGCVRAMAWAHDYEVHPHGGYPEDYEIAKKAEANLRDAWVCRKVLRRDLEEGS